MDSRALVAGMGAIHGPRLSQPLSAHMVQPVHIRDWRLEPLVKRPAGPSGALLITLNPPLWQGQYFFFTRTDVNADSDLSSMPAEPLPDLPSEGFQIAYSASTVFFTPVLHRSKNPFCFGKEQHWVMNFGDPGSCTDMIWEQSA